MQAKTNIGVEIFPLLEPRRLPITSIVNRHLHRALLTFHEKCNICKAYVGHLRGEGRGTLQGKIPMLALACQVMADIEGNAIPGHIQPGVFGEAAHASMQ